MLGRIPLTGNQVTELERKRKLAEEHVRVLKAALDARDGPIAFMPKETVVTQRMYLRMMEIRLDRINAKLRLDPPTEQGPDAGAL